MRWCVIVGAMALVMGCQPSAPKDGEAPGAEQASEATEAPTKAAPTTEAPTKAPPAEDAPAKAAAPDAPPADPATPTGSAPAGDGSKPGEHGCGACLARACLSGGALTRIDLRLDLEIEQKDVTYQRANLRISGAAGAEVFPVERGKIVAGTPTTVRVAADKAVTLRSADAWKGAKGTLQLYWSTPTGPGAQQLNLPVSAGACP